MNTQLLFVGRARRQELQHVLQCLREVTGQLRVVDDIPAALEVLATAPEIQRLILAPSFRGEFTEQQERQLLTTRPLAEMIVLVGPWIEGETRSGRPWRGAQRLYLHQLPAWAKSAQMASVAPPGSGWQPATLSNDETWERSAHAPWPELAGCVAICGELEESRRSLEAACSAFGLRTVRMPLDSMIGGDGIDFVLYDAVGDRRRWNDQVRYLSRCYRPKRLVVLANFPRPGEIDGLTQSGATAVLGKPYRLQGLASALDVRTP